MKLTKKQLLESIKDLDDDAIVYCERITDIHFEKYGWSKNSEKLPCALIEGDFDEFYLSSQVTTNGKDKIYIHGHM